MCIATTPPLNELQLSIFKGPWDSSKTISDL